MSRIGKQPISIPSGVTITVDDDFVTVTGSKGTLKQFTMPGITAEVKDGNVYVTRVDDEKVHRSKHGLMRTLIANMITGVSEGFSKKLEVNGVGFKVAMQGADLKMSLGFSHEVIYKVPIGITIAVEANTITVSGIDKQAVGQAAAEIRAFKKPEPYKGKGIKYIDERVLRKSGKSGKE